MLFVSFNSCTCFLNISNFEENSSFILFEDKYAYLGVDFAWHYDKNTYRLRPVLLSEGTIKLKNLPEELSCVIISNN